MYLITPERQAILNTINWAEGSPDWNELFAYVPFNNYGPHPNLVVTSGGYSSTAAGAYQILYSTWHMAIDALGLPDYMSPENQMQVALYLIDYRGALGDVDNGNIEAAINKISWEWASLPPSRYGQPIRTMDEVLDKYNSELGSNSGIMVAGGAVLGILTIGLLISTIKGRKLAL
jgi:muramidase (phage lysozyme)